MQSVEIEIAGLLDPEWEEWFEGFDLIHTQEATTVLMSASCDQAGFYGLMGKLRDLGVELISVSYDPSAALAEGPGDEPEQEGNRSAV